MLSTRTLASLALTPALLSVALAAPAQQTPAQPENTSPAPTDSAAPAANTDTTDVHTGIRIVRLSQAKGAVTMNRGAGVDQAANGKQADGFEAAFDNLPVVQGAQLRTADGVAEVEFEDNSTLRLAPDTLVRFVTLSRSPAGATTSVMEVLHGMVYASLAKPHGKEAQGNQFVVSFGSRRAVLAPGAHIRLEVDAPTTHLAVLDGSATVEAASGNTVLAKKHGLRIEAGNPEVSTLIDKEAAADRAGAQGSLDLWDKQSASYHQQVSNVSAYAGGGGGGLYGLNDMNYYGSFVNMGGGCGSMWQPYFAGAGWNPYSYGVWAYYPSAGYSWVSPYPWGWTPFHSGMWQQCGANGWGWRPTGSFVGLRNTSLLAGSPLHNRPPLVPARGALGLVVVNAAHVPASQPTAEHTFVFQKDSAGLGVPRESFGKLSEPSKLVAQHGSANIPVSFALPAAPRAGAQNSSIAGRSALIGSLHPVSEGPVSAGVHPVATYNGSYAPSTSAPLSANNPPPNQTHTAPSSAPSSGARSGSTGAAGGAHR